MFCYFSRFGDFCHRPDIKVEHRGLAGQEQITSAARAAYRHQAHLGFIRLLSDGVPEDNLYGDYQPLTPIPAFHAIGGF
jgi:hypothetical protein